MSTQNSLALTLRSLHNPRSPLLLLNVWDAISATAIASLPSTTALATASFAIAAAAGLPDASLTLDINLRAAAAISRIASQHNLPLTVDFQDGFGEQLEEGVRAVIKLGAVGINLEDFGREVKGVDGGEGGGLYSVEEAMERIRRVMRVAGEEGVPDFVVNARTDALFTPTAGEQDGAVGGGGSLDEAIRRGKAYLEAGAANVFIWGGPERKGWGRSEVERAVRELDGRLNVILQRMTPGGLTVDELKEIGVARISVGPQLMLRTKGCVGEEAERILAGGGV